MIKLVPISIFENEVDKAMNYYKAILVVVH